MRIPRAKIADLAVRCDEIREWIVETSPQILEEQRQLDAGTVERAYWHYGYQAALSDVLGALSYSDQADNRGTLN